MSEIYVPDAGGHLREARLHELRREAERNGRVDGHGIRAAGAPLPPNARVDARASAENGYYGVPLLKAPQWKWEIPFYFFTGGFAGAASIMASFAKLTRADHELVRDARLLAAIGGSISPALLIADLGMPSRFLNMLRVFKFQSPMSMGSWTLVAFSSSTAGLSFLDLTRRRFDLYRSGPGLRVLENAAEFLSVISGAVLATYTGVLIGATAVPVWNENVGILPIHFAASGMGTAASLLELRGHQAPALNGLGIASAAVETVVGASIELRQKPVLNPLKKGKSGWLTRIGGMLAGPLPLALRVWSLFAGGRRKSNLRKVAAVSAVAGSVVTRFAWVQAGKASADDPRIPLQLPPAPASTEQIASASEISPA
ncbi:MAG TPA: NrfD/PsrC family molybdoenzyme membrane anchor subunit [Candidatus Acidoferrales bacterium]|jgi:hypothetical protein|nr:NrfD/PsrC family molybdoenzyme membrane anchor subunit [Candidatus Acidoferrales bacterium]